MQSVTPINTVNNTLNFYPADGNWEIARLPFKASVEITDGYLVAYEVSGSSPTGYLTLAPTTTSSFTVEGAIFASLIISSSSAIRPSI